MTTTILAIDGGQSGTRARLHTGHDVSTGAGPGFTYRVDDPARALGAAAAAAVTETGWTRQEASLCAAAGLSGLPFGADADRVAAELAHPLGSGVLYLCGDHVTAHAGALPDGRGVVLSLGTGTVAVGATEAGIRVVDGWGHLIDDAGSASWFGRAALRAALRHLDHRGAAPALFAAVQELLGDVAAASRRLHESRHPSRELARLAPLVFRAADEGDPAARRIVSEGAAELAATAAAAVPTAASSARGHLPVAVIGGLTRAGEALLDPLAVALADALPAARIVAAAGDCLDGAERIVRHGPGPYHAFVSEYRIHEGRATAIRRADRER